MNKYDYIILGSGIAGLYSALLAREHGTVLIITKGSIEDCNTRHAQGGIAAPIGKYDSPDLHFKDTIAAGDGLCDVEAVKILSHEAADRIADLINYGVRFDTLDGEIALTKEAAHSVSRILHAGGDATGEHIEVTLSRRIKMSKIKVLENCIATNIVVREGEVKGVVALDSRTGLVESFECSFIILATGGAGRLYKYTTNSDVSTGDGIAIAYKAGAEVIDMEFFQFHPTAIRIPGVPPFLISEAVRGEGGILRDAKGYRFMTDYAKEGELAPRDVVSRSIVHQMKKTKSDWVFLDVTHLPSRQITTRFPNIFRFCLDHGINITKDHIPVAPAAHYFMGGVRVNSWGESNINGLFAAGEVACTGVHGANRLASNSLLEVVVFAKRIIERTRQLKKKAASQKRKTMLISLQQRDLLRNVPPLSISSFQTLMWENVGILRRGVLLAKAANILYSWQSTLQEPSDRPTIEMSNMIITARLVTEAALIREESRGAHYRNDFPKSSPNWIKHIIFKT